MMQSVALIASAEENSIAMDGPCEIPRRVTVEGVQGLVENGVACDVLTSGMAAVISANDPADEKFQLNATQANLAVGLIGIQKCIDLGVLDITAQP